MNARANDAAAFLDGLKRRGDELANWRVDDRGVQTLWRCVV
jgi:hypothetical protein